MRVAIPERRALAYPTRHLEMGAVEVRDDGSRGLILRGHAAVHNAWSENLGGFREQIAPGAFRGITKQDVRLTINHDPNRVLARSTGSLELRQDPRGLGVTARVANTSYARDLDELMSSGIVNQMSFMFAEPVRDRWGVGEDGLPERTVLEFGTIYDVAVVTYPAYRQTDASMGGRMVEVDLPEPVSENAPEEGVQGEMKRRLALARARGCTGSGHG